MASYGCASHCPEQQSKFTKGMPFFKGPYELFINFDVYFPLVDKKKTASNFTLFEEILPLHGLGIDHFLANDFEFLPRERREELMVLQLLDSEMQLRVIEFL